MSILYVSNVISTNTQATSGIVLGTGELGQNTQVTVGDVVVNSSAVTVGSVVANNTLNTPKLAIGGSLFDGSIFSGVVDYQEFTANSTWYNPYNNSAVNATLTGYEQVLIMAWGGGGGGTTGTNGQAGGGGGCFIYTGELADFTSTCAVLVGTGGTAGTAGASSSFAVNATSSVIAYGGGGGTGGIGGGGGGTLSAGSNGGAGGAPLGGLQATPGGASTYGGGGPGNNAPANGGASVFGGGGGARATGVGGTSIFGGAGGSNGAVVATSTFGGSGASATVSATAPGGGGTTGSSTGSAIGARGEVRVWVLGRGGSTLGPPAYSFVANTTTLFEGSSVKYDITTSNVPNGTALYYTLNNSSTAVSSDFTAAVNGAVYVSSGSASFTLTANNDGVLDGSRTVLMDLRTDSSTGTIVASNNSVTLDEPTATLTYSTVLSNTNNNTTYTFAAAAIGTAASNRVVALAIAKQTSGVQSVTIGGITATIIQAGTDLGAIAYAVVPTGTTADIVVTGNGGDSRCGIWVFAIYPGNSTTPYQTNTVSSGASMSLTYPNGAVGLIQTTRTGGNGDYTTVWDGTGTATNYAGDFSSSNFRWEALSLSGLTSASTTTSTFSSNNSALRISGAIWR